jgi:hypothetical protein
MAAKSRTANFYASNPEARKKKQAYDVARNKSEKSKKYRRELSRERRARGIMGKGGPDVSHVKGGGYKLEAPSKNRARQGANGKSTKANGKGTKKSK